MLLIPFLNPGGRMRVMPNKIVVVGASGKPLKPSGPAYKETIEKLKKGQGRRLKDGRVKIGKRYVEITERVTKSKAPKTTRAAAKLKASDKQKRAGEFSAAVEARRTSTKRKAAQKRRDAKKPSAKEKQAATRAKRGYTRGRSYKKGTAYAARPETIKWSEAASASGAVYPAIGPDGNALPKSKVGRPMSFRDALTYQVPVVGFLSRGMIKGFSERLPKTITGDIDTRKRREIQAANDWLETKRFGGVRTKDGKFVPLKREGGKSNKKAVERALKKKGSKKIRGLDETRRKRGSAWKRMPKFYSRTGKSPGGKKYVKGRRKPDYKQYWSDEPASWQTGGAGRHLRVDFRSKRGPSTSPRLFFGFGPQEGEVEELELAGFGAPLDEPGGVMKLNKPTRRKNSRRRKKARRNPPKRNSKGRFVKTNGRRRKTKKKARKRKAKANGRRKTAAAKVYNNPRKPKRNRKGRFVKTNGRKARKNAGRKTTARKGRRRRARRNPGVWEALTKPVALAQRSGFVKRAAHVMIGMGGTAALGSFLSGYLPRELQRSGAWGTLGRFVSCFGAASLLSGAAYMGRDAKLIGQQGFQDVFLGGFAYCTANLIMEIAGYGPALMINFGPLQGGYPSMPAPAGSGVADWMELSGMGQGTSVISPYDLVSGESEARLYTMDGMGQGGRPVPIEDLRGYPGQYGGGMNDWVEFSSMPVAEAFSATEGGPVGGPGETF